jgi:FAD/FMN-containing dehydrogenase
MPSLPPPAALRDLAARLSGALRLDDVALAIYSTDASEYQERPLAVALPKTEADVRELVRFAAAHRVPLVPGQPALRSPVRWWGAGSSSMPADI